MPLLAPAAARRTAPALLLLGALVCCSAAAPARASAAAAAPAAWVPARLRVERLDQRDALGIDTAHPLLSWVWNAAPARPAPPRGAPVPSAADVQVEVALEPFADGLHRAQPSAGAGPATAAVAGTALLWNAAPSALSPTTLRYAGPALPSATRVHWRVCAIVAAHPNTTNAPLERHCATASFVTGLMHPADWGGAEWLSGRQLRSPAVVIPDSVTSAVVAVTGLGFYELYLNGARVGDAIMDPGFSTNYTQRILYAVYDITDATVPANGGAGKVVVAARVGASKYSYAVNPFATPGGDVFVFKLALTIGFANGTTATILVTTDGGGGGGWLEGDSPIVWDNVYEGEVYDARLAEAGWAAPNFNASAAAGWRPARAMARLPAGADAVMSARLFPPIRVVDVVTPVNTTVLDARGSFFYDLGNNYAGVARVAVPAGLPAGATLAVVCTEYLGVATSAWGAADIYNQQDLYICSGKEAAGTTWEPSFVYHGFRYVRVDVRTAPPANGTSPALAAAPTVKGLFLHSDVASKGELRIGRRAVAAAAAATEETGGNPAPRDATALAAAAAGDVGAVLDAVQRCVVQTQLDNLHSHPTDCPQREKRGWMGDAQWTAEEAMLNLDMDSLYYNWVRTMTDVQTAGCTHSQPDSHGQQNMSGYCWVYDSDDAAADDNTTTTTVAVPGFMASTVGIGHLTPCNLTNSFCCLPTPAGSDPLHPSIGNCSPQYNQSDVAGSVPDVVPNHWGRGGSRGWPGTPTWSSAVVVIPGVLLQYGDAGVAGDFYNSVKAHVDFLARQEGHGGIDDIPSFGMMGDWCSIEPFCPGSSDACLQNPGWTGAGDATTSFYFIKDLEVLIDMAAATNRSVDVAKYTPALARARAAYYRTYFNVSTQDFGPTQTGNSLGILASPVGADVTGAARRLLANLAARNGTIATGAVGARWILQALTAVDEHAAALALASQTAGPSWYWFAAHAPGTLREQWPHGPTPSGVTAGSLNHIMMGGGVGVWLHEEVGGLRVRRRRSCSGGGGGGGGGNSLFRDANSPAVVFEFGVSREVVARVGEASTSTRVVGGFTVASSWRAVGAATAANGSGSSSSPSFSSASASPAHSHLAPVRGDATAVLEYNCTVPPLPLAADGDAAAPRATLTLPWSDGAVALEGGAVVWPHSRAGAVVGVEGAVVDEDRRTLTLTLTAAGQFVVRLENLAL